MALKFKVTTQRRGNVTLFLGKLSNGNFIRKFNKDIKDYMIKSTQYKLIAQSFNPKAKSLSPLTLRTKISNKMLIESGGLLQSIKGSSNRKEIIVGSNKKYAKIQNRGGVIRAKNANKLLIPSDPIVKRYGYNKNNSGYGVLSLMKHDGWKIIWTSNAVIGKLNNQKKLLFVRKEQVTIPKRRFLYISKIDKFNFHEILKMNIKRAKIQWIF